MQINDNVQNLYGKYMILINRNAGNNTDNSVTETETNLLSENIYDTVEFSHSSEQVSQPVVMAQKSASDFNRVLTLNDIKSLGDNATNVQYIKEIIYKTQHASNSLITDSDVGRKIGDGFDLLLYARKALDDKSINISNGITRAQLLKLTQRDDFEDNKANFNFFGNLNSVFNKIDENDDGKLSISELKDFSGWEFRSEDDFNAKVNTYANELQEKYVKLSDQGKLEFVIARTAEYLDAAGLQDQLNALNRLTDQEDLYKKSKYANVGQISMAELPITETDLGNGYVSYTVVGGSYNQVPAATFRYDQYNRALIFKTDKDSTDNGGDLGINLNYKWYMTNEYSQNTWYNLVSVLVHELTHATAYLYAPDELSEDEEITIYDPPISQHGLYKLFEAGAITDEEYNTYMTALENNTLNYGHADYRKLVYLATTMWGEYSAYQTQEDYLDSVGKGEYTGGSEKNGITKHIDDMGYNKTEPTLLAFGDGTASIREAMPDGDWWVTYKQNA